MQMLGFNFRGRGWLRLEVFGGAVFWCVGCFVGFGGIPFFNGGRKLSSVLYKGKKPHKKWEWWNHLGHIQPLKVSIMEDPTSI